MQAITYVSTAKKLFSQEYLLALLEKSRANNTRFDITGLLLYKDGCFMQAIEGPPEHIQQLYTNIRNDPAHSNVITLLDQQVNERSFADWSMAFGNLSDMPSDKVPGFSNFLREPNICQFQGAPSEAQQLLLGFRQWIR